MKGLSVVGACAVHSCIATFADNEVWVHTINARIKLQLELNLQKCLYAADVAGDDDDDDAENDLDHYCQLNIAEFPKHFQRREAATQHRTTQYSN